MFIPYVKGFVIGKQSLNPNEWKEFKNTQDKHYKQASHHSQFWDKSWTHDGQIPDVCGKMPDDAIIEMCADWCAMSKNMVILHLNGQMKTLINYGNLINTKSN